MDIEFKSDSLKKQKRSGDVRRGRSVRTVETTAVEKKGKKKKRREKVVKLSFFFLIFLLDDKWLNFVGLVKNKILNFLKMCSGYDDAP